MRPRHISRAQLPLSEKQAPVQRRSNAALRTAAPALAPVDSAQLWVGVQVASSLQQLAVRAQRFTPRVSLVPPDGLVLEVKGSLHLFGGVEGLLQAVTAECVALGLQAAPTLAPTPMAAMVAARTGVSFIVTHQAQLVSKLAPLPLAPLRWPQEMIQRLARMGVRTIGQVLRLPRAGFARRFGELQLAELDRLTGRSADPRHRFQVHERFRRRRELTYELENNATLLAVLTPLLADLSRFLQARQCGVTAIECWLWHRHAQPTICRLELTAPLADGAHLAQLLGERLNQLVLPEPVRSCELRSGPLVPRALTSHSLWRPGEHGAGSGSESPHFIERLQARLGAGAVYSVQVVPGHRPESAWSVRAPGAATQAAGKDQRQSQPEGPVVSRRPVWLLMEPQRLDERDGVPLRGGPLRLSADLERIETGWWDERDIGRDYYQAVDINGARLWIFRERALPRGWFLHGVFG